MRPRGWTWAWLALAVFLAVAPGCGGEDSQEAEARAIFEKALDLERSGDIMGALAEYDKLAQYPETQVYAEASEALESEGLTIGSAFSSYTLQEMFDILNAIVDKGWTEPPDGIPLAELPEIDAWGTHYWIEYSDGKKFFFAIRSAGPDRLLRTPDDLALYHRTSAGRQTAGPPAPAAPEASPTGPAPGSQEYPIASPGAASGSETAAESPVKRGREEVVDLNDLLKTD